MSGIDDSNDYLGSSSSSHKWLELILLIIYIYGRRLCIKYKKIQIQTRTINKKYYWNINNIIINNNNLILFIPEIRTDCFESQQPILKLVKWRVGTEIFLLRMLQLVLYNSLTACWDKPYNML